MNIDDLTKKLSQLDAAVLQDYVLGLYLNYPDLTDSIETLVLFNDPPVLKKAIAKRITSLKRGRRFIDYRASTAFARDLEGILADIERGLLDSAPKLAFELVDKFLATAESVLNRVDDSSGEIGGVYRDAVLLWLTAAKAWGDTKIDWQERVYQLYESNDYGVLDPLLPNSHILLDGDQLKQLAWRYELEARQAVRDKDPEDQLGWASITRRVALGSVAEALKDPALYERSVLICSPEPNDLQKKDIVAMYIRFGQFDEALRWLNTDWESRFETDRLVLCEQLYEQSGDSDQLCRVRQTLYQREQSFTRLERYLAVLNKDEQAAVRQQAIEQAEQGRDLTVSANLLLQLDEVERAQQLVVSRYAELADCFYGTLTNLVKQFDKAACPLASTACYRALLLDILQSGRTTAYTHAARYYKKLEALADQIIDFTPLAGRKAFLNQLEREHGRKRSFWERVR